VSGSTRHSRRAPRWRASVGGSGNELAEIRSGASNPFYLDYLLSINAYCLQACNSTPYEEEAASGICPLIPMAPAPDRWLARLVPFEPPTSDLQRGR